MFNLFETQRYIDSPESAILIALLENNEFLFNQHIDFIRNNENIFINEEMLNDRKINILIKKLPAKTFESKSVNIDELLCAAISVKLIDPDSSILTTYLKNKLPKNPVKILGTIISNKDYLNHLLSLLDFNVVDENQENLLFIFKYRYEESFKYYDKTKILQFIDKEDNYKLFNIHQMNDSGYPFFVDSDLSGLDEKDKYQELLLKVLKNNKYNDDQIKILNATILKKFPDLLMKIDAHKFIFHDIDPYAAVYGERVPSIRRLISQTGCNTNYIKRFYDNQPDGYNYIADPENPQNLLHYLANSNYEREFARFFFSQNIDINLQNKSGDTPFHLLIKEFNSDIENMPFITQIAYIINSNKADLSLTNNDGFSIKDLIFSKPDSQLTQIYAEYEKNLILNNFKDINTETNLDMKKRRI